MNEVINNIETRRSIRSYTDKMVDEKTLSLIAEAGTYAPSAMNRQPAIILMITNKEIRDKLSRLNAEIMGSQSDPFYSAPVVAVVLADKNDPCRVYDGSLVMENMMLAAHSLGVSSCWIHRAKEVFETKEGKAILSELGIKGDYEGIGNCILGYSDKADNQPAKRKDGYVHFVR